MRNYDSTAESIVSLLGKLFHFKTVMDVGCTEKAWLKAFKKSGAEVFGVCMIGHETDFQGEIRTQSIDFGRSRFNVQEKQDLALSIDFVEKFPLEYVDRYIDDLTKVSDCVLFSSQLPDVLSSIAKTGKERQASYWKEKFKTRGFVLIDCIRTQVWDSEEILLQYRQSMVLYVREKCLSQYPYLLNYYLKHFDQEFLDVIHPMQLLNDVNYWKSRVNALMAELEEKKPKRVLYTFYHPVALAWVIIHKLKMHPLDEVYFLVSRDGMNWKSPEKYNLLIRLIEEGFVKGVYTYRMTLGNNSKIESVSDCETEIISGVDCDFREQFFDIRSFDKIYSHTDAHDTLGVYFSIKKIPYCWFEASIDGFFIKADERVISHDLASSVAYRDTIIKHKTLVGLNDCETVIVNPKSKLPKQFDLNKIEFFDVENAAYNLSDTDKKLILAIYDMSDMPPTNRNTTMIAPQSFWWTYEMYNKCSYIREKYRNATEYGMYSMQIMQDYYVPQNTIIVHKPHPSIYINKDMIRRYFNGAYFYHNLFTYNLMQILPKECRHPQYIVHTLSSVYKQFPEDTIKIDCSGVWLFALFYNKYYATLSALSNADYLYANAGEKFSNIGKEGEKIGYNNMRMAIDINSLIKVQFLKVPKKSTANYLIQQVNPNSIVAETLLRDFLIYTDIWETLSFEQLQAISQQVNAGIIKISKKPMKPLEDILVPLQDEYIFIFSKDVSYIEKLKEFSAVKLNKAMGIELNARMISMEEYATSQVGN